MHKRFYFTLLFLSLFVLSFAQSNSQETYIKKYSDLAVREMKRVGIPASITLAQGMLESGNGKSELALKSNNHFGIKCHDDWTGKKVYYDDDSKGECFRKYNNVYDSYLDHSDFLVSKQRYASLFQLKKTDYKGWAHGLKKAGYATDPRYAKRLIGIIETYHLDRFDKGVKVSKNNDYVDTESGDDADEKTSGKRSANIDHFEIVTEQHHELGVNNGVKYVDVQDGDTFESICKEFGLKSWEIFSYNDLEEGANISDYKHLYVQSKRNKAFPNHKTHRVKAGESMHYISQKYGVKLKRLYRLNNMKYGEKVKEGQIINLRRRKK